MKPQAIEDPVVEEVADAVGQLGLVLGHARLYGARHKRTEDAATQALQDLQRQIEVHGALELRASLEGLAWGEQLVYLEAEEGLGFGRMLHREGIRSIRLEPGLDVASLQAFVDILRVNLALSEHEEDTLELLLWQAQLQGIGFEAVSALTEAELLSNRLKDAQARGDDDAEDMLLELAEAEAERKERAQQGKKLVSEDGLHAAMASSDERVGAGEGDDDLSEEAWETTFADTAEEDEAAMEAIRQEVEAEQGSDLLARLCILLFEVAEANRSELPGRDAVGRAKEALEEIYRRGDPVGLTQLLLEGRRLHGDPTLKERRGAAAAIKFVRHSLDPMRVARMLSKADPTQDRQTALAMKELVQRLPDEALQSMLIWSTEGKDARSARVQGLVKVVGRVAGDRVEAWLENSKRLPAEQVVPILGALRALGDGRGLERRVELMKHPAPLVRQAAVLWCEDDLQANEIRPLLECLLDRDGRVRQAASHVIQEHNRPETLRWFLNQTESPRFEKLYDRARLEFFFTMGQVVGSPAIRPMVERLEKMGALSRSFGNETLLQETREAAWGLAGVGTGAARQVLEKHANAFGSGPKRTFCKEALGKMNRSASG